MRIEKEQILAIDISHMNLVVELYASTVKVAGA